MMTFPGAWGTAATGSREQLIRKHDNVRTLICRKWLEITCLVMHELAVSHVVIKILL